jgi:hypothetical protein
MTPKEKAKDLFYKISFDNNKHIAKRCTLITVNEILDVLFQHHKIDYWKEVKQEIEKL